MPHRVTKRLRAAGQQAQAASEGSQPSLQARWLDIPAAGCSGARASWRTGAAVIALLGVHSTTTCKLHLHPRSICTNAGKELHQLALEQTDAACRAADSSCSFLMEARRDAMINSRSQNTSTGHGVLTPHSYIQISATQASRRMHACVRPRASAPTPSTIGPPLLQGTPDIPRITKSLSSAEVESDEVCTRNQMRSSVKVSVCPAKSVHL